MGLFDFTMDLIDSATGINGYQIKAKAREELRKLTDEELLSIANGPPTSSYRWSPSKVDALNEVLKERGYKWLD